MHAIMMTAMVSQTSNVNSLLEIPTHLHREGSKWSRGREREGETVINTNNRQKLWIGRGKPGENEAYANGTERENREDELDSLETTLTRCWTHGQLISRCLSLQSIVKLINYRLVTLSTRESEKPLRETIERNQQVRRDSDAHSCCAHLDTLLFLLDL